ncbi:hypothetical protein AVEN_88439-1 [Araneus ventricosus]|uniref:Uncharacterized protein n=1 Tax=Araneus ventricosus TaxID=182803 RepID=A0A4Y2LDJ7_ARAVE|nr:hypothetical protein AVEN_88439-1 [Araneus ventricosus]
MCDNQAASRIWGSYRALHRGYGSSGLYGCSWVTGLMFRFMCAANPGVNPPEDFGGVQDRLGSLTRSDMPGGAIKSYVFMINHLFVGMLCWIRVLDHIGIVDA